MGNDSGAAADVCLVRWPDTMQPRQALHGCRLCDERKAAISPEAIQGRHDSLGVLEESVVDAIHRITRDAGRLSRSWFERVTANSESFSDGHYVEMLGILVTVLGIDSFHRGIGLPPEPLPSPIKGEPSLYRPKAAVADGAYVPMLPFEAAQGDESDLWKGHSGGNVTRAMSLVPDAVRQLNDIEAIYYLSVSEIASPTHNGGKAIDREQIEFLASRVSALNECFY